MYNTDLLLTNIIPYTLHLYMYKYVHFQIRYLCHNLVAHLPITSEDL